jgi:hypothetical protein
MSKTVNNFAGLNGFVWWVGEIINRVDELGLSRYQVRIFGWYGDSIQDSDLPWAQAMLAPNASKTFEPMSIGSWVVGFFMDGESGQFPIIMGVLPGVSQVNTGIDPNSKTVSSSVSNPYTN